jgi:hypothetical protein
LELEKKLEESKNKSCKKVVIEEIKVEKDIEI